MNGSNLEVLDLGISLGESWGIWNLPWGNWLWNRGTGDWELGSYSCLEGSGLGGAACLEDCGLAGSGLEEAVLLKRSCWKRSCWKLEVPDVLEVRALVPKTLEKSPVVSSTPPPTMGRWV